MTKPLSQTEIDAYKMASDFKDLVAKRTGLKPQELVCPREKSDMTPCVARDGELAVCFDARDVALCVGCEHRVTALMETERAKHTT